MLSSQDDFTFLEKTPQLREELQEAIREGYQPLGLLGWEISEGRIQAHKMFFRWHEAAGLSERFDQICEAGVDSVSPASGEPREP